MSDKPKVCRKPQDAVLFFRQSVESANAPNPEREAFWIVTLNRAWEFVRAFEPATKAFGDPQRFSDEVFSEPFVRYAKQIVLIHHRPGIAPAPASEDTGRVRALILAGREKGIALLDAIIIGQPSDDHPAGCFSFQQLRNFSAPVPFEEKPKSTVTHSKYA